MSEPSRSLPVAGAFAAGQAPLRLRLAADKLATRILFAVLLSILCAAALITLSGHEPVTAFAAMAAGAIGSPHQVGAALNRTTPYLLAGTGVALCFRAGIINIGRLDANSDFFTRVLHLVKDPQGRCFLPNLRVSYSPTYSPA